MILDFHNNENRFFKIIYFPLVISLTSGPRFLFCPGPPVLNCKPSSVLSGVFFLPIHFVMVLRETVYFVCSMLDGPLLESQTASWGVTWCGVGHPGLPNNHSVPSDFQLLPCLCAMSANNDLIFSSDGPDLLLTQNCL